MSRTEYKNDYKKVKYDRLELTLPNGWKDRLKEISSIMGISLNEYVCRLIKQDIYNDHKPEDMVTMLNRWEVKGKYHPMIEEISIVSFTFYPIFIVSPFLLPLFFEHKTRLLQGAFHKDLLMY